MGLVVTVTAVLCWVGSTTRLRARLKRSPSRVGEALRGQAIRCGLGGGLALGPLRDPGRFDRRVALGARRSRVVVLEQQRCQPPPHVPFDVIGEHAQGDMTAHVVLAANVDRADPQMVLARAEGPLDAGEAGTDGVKVVEPGHGLDAVLVALESEAVCGDVDGKVLAHWLAVGVLSDPAPDGRLADQTSWSGCVFVVELTRFAGPVVG